MREHREFGFVTKRIGCGLGNQERSDHSWARASVGVVLIRLLAEQGAVVSSDSAARRLIGEAMAVGRRVALEIDGDDLAPLVGEQGLEQNWVRRRLNYPSPPQGHAKRQIKPKAWTALASRISQVAAGNVHPCAAAAVVLHELTDLSLEQACTAVLSGVAELQLPGAYQCQQAGLLYRARALVKGLRPVADPAELLPEAEPAAKAQGDGGSSVESHPSPAVGVDEAFAAEELNDVVQRFPVGSWVEGFGPLCGRVVDHRYGLPDRVTPWSKPLAQVLLERDDGKLSWQPAQTLHLSADGDWYGSGTIRTAVRPAVASAGANRVVHPGTIRSSAVLDEPMAPSWILDLF